MLSARDLLYRKPAVVCQKLQLPAPPILL